MPKSCRSILRSLLYKKVIDERTYGKLERNMYGSDAQVVRWNTGAPKRGGKYLVTRRVPSYTEYGKTTHIVDTCSYGNIETYYGEKKRCWYVFDSEYGHYEVEDVVSWAAMPAGYVPEEEVGKDILTAMKESAEAVKNSPHYDFSCVTSLFREEGAEN